LQESQAAMFGMSQPQTNLWIHLLKSVLLQSLQASKSLPCRDFDSLKNKALYGMCKAFLIRSLLRYAPFTPLLFKAFASAEFPLASRNRSSIVILFFIFIFTKFAA
jgi:hypothetical protein